MGPLYEIVSAMEAHCPHVQVGIVTGRNRQLKARLQQRNWQGTVYVYGFVDHVRHMPSLMSAADVLVTKAGPGTLHEAFLAGLPLILSGAVPGQEEGNVRRVVNGGAGVWAPDPCEIATLVNRWTGQFDGTLSRMSMCSRALARPDAATAVADEIERFLSGAATAS
jgi:1,2-diacylglycerol 3-beta-galactosyltransferase